MAPRCLALLALCATACGSDDEYTAQTAPTPAARPEPPALAVPTVSRGTTDAPSDATPLVIALDAIRSGDGPPIATLANGRVGPEDRRGEGGFLIVPLRDRLLDARGEGPVPVAIHPGVPYRTVSEVLYTIGQAERTRVELLVRREESLASLPLTFPRVESRRMILGTLGDDEGALADVLAGGAVETDAFEDAEGVTAAPEPDPEPADTGDVPVARTSSLDEETSSLGLSATITASGVLIAGAGGLLAPGCEVTQLGRRPPTIPRGADGVDLGALERCLTRVKREFPDETAIIVSADPDVSFGEVAAVIAASRGSSERPLFPDTIVGVR